MQIKKSCITVFVGQPQKNRSPSYRHLKAARNFDFNFSIKITTVSNQADKSNYGALTPFSCSFSPQLPELLLKLNCSIAISTYQAGKISIDQPYR